MAANLQKSEFHQQPLGGFSGRLVLNLSKGDFFTRINPLDSGDQMPSQKRLIDTGVDTFVGDGLHPKI
jgi:hypothetical protein